MRGHVPHAYQDAQKSEGPGELINHEGVFGGELILRRADVGGEGGLDRLDLGLYLSLCGAVSCFISRSSRLKFRQ